MQPPTRNAIDDNPSSNASQVHPDDGSGSANLMSVIARCATKRRTHDFGSVGRPALNPCDFGH
jgi:hypothetical protein